MKYLGIKRKIDCLGRIVISKEYRRALNLNEGDTFEAYLGEVDGGKVVFVKKDNTKE